jgi:hypothetical protein
VLEKTSPARCRAQTAYADLTKQRPSLRWVPLPRAGAIADGFVMRSSLMGEHVGNDRANSIGLAVDDYDILTPHEVQEVGV